MFEIIRLTESSLVDLNRINHLLRELSFGKERIISQQDLDEALCNPNFYIYLAVERNPAASSSDLVVGMGTVFFQRNLARWIAEIHDVVVDTRYQELGVGRLLTNQLLAAAQAFAVERQCDIKLYLTSRPTRERANRLYTSLGFVLVAAATGEWGTNLYKLIISPQGSRGLA